MKILYYYGKYHNLYNYILEKTIKLIDIANRIDESLEGNDAKEILKVIGDYSDVIIDLVMNFLNNDWDLISATTYIYIKDFVLKEVEKTV